MSHFLRKFWSHDAGQDIAEYAGRNAGRHFGIGGRYDSLPTPAGDFSIGIELLPGGY